MGAKFVFLTLLFIALVLLSLFIGFIYIWLTIAKKDNLVKLLKYKTLKKEKGNMVERLWKPFLRAAEYVAPTTAKYRLFTKENDKVMLDRSGNPFQLSLDGFYGLRYVLFFTFFIFTWLYMIIGMPFGLLLFITTPYLAFFFPNFWIWYKARERQELISEAMPDFLDTVSVTLQAGVGLDTALRQVSNQMEGPLSEEIQRFSREIDLGVTRKIAYQNLLNRNTSRELEILVNSLIQGTALGVPVSTTFKIQADDLRSMRGFRAKEKAAKASPQITLVTTFLVAPSVFLLIIGLLFLNIIYNPEAFGLNVFFG
ncbi:type II secretion system F family protein [Alkalihalobacillus sp. LMS39]|uniref:type II secretion system F family protein n=1 Tax=Alkalihalobacillus sp. LMS39 TaxID=2924032 RepID=UPI001FB56748|nr:type II secretion system F family protein [Alkalihalobacillus sp. LMS39]UOE92261.1 type II secretion system F family protein [Alkalihalobacillus sp. LMS39]